ncbi:MAG TPA: alpha-amylase family glycosyl hydrolase [Acidimicrobiales bacterium]|nr:alpha-amylase family glycosyl hydrolase [Acidimicrobiales bacterium]
MTNAAGSAVGEQWPWWKDAVFYQIYPRSFCLADPAGRRRRLASDPEPRSTPAHDRVRDGAGDLEGVRRHLDHLVWLGVDAIWLSPFYRSPMKDFGYDVSDYRAVDPLFGSTEDFDRLVADAHDRGLRVIVDFVPNHTSDQHPWFLEARSSRESDHRDFYVWRDPDPADPARPPNNWRRSFGEGPAWTFDDVTGQWYLHLFLPEQPDLDWSNRVVVDEMEGVVGYWLDRGVDGFRIDVVHALGKDPSLRDAPAERAAIPWSVQNDDPSTHPILRRLRRYVDSYPQEPVTVGEVFLIDTALVAKYYGDGDELHLAFNFPPMFCPFEARCFKRRVSEIERMLGPIGAWPTWVLSSHDRPRHRTRYGGSERRARAAAVMLLSMRGTPFLYAGEELGLEDAAIPAALVVDPGGRDGCRAPIPWDGAPAHGWALDDGPAWLPWPPEADRRNVTTLADDAGSILHLYRRLLAYRRSTPALRRGDLELLDTSGDVLAVRRTLDGDDRWVAVNFGAEAADWAPAPDARYTVEITSAGDTASIAGAEYSRSLGPEEAVILRRR